MSDWLPLALVLTSACCHAVWNASLKQMEDKQAAMATIMASGGIMVLPFVPFIPLPDGQMLLWILLSSLIHLVYQQCLIRSYELADMSIVYPFARGFGPVLVALAAPYLFGEDMTFLAGVGVATVTLGIWSLIFTEYHRRSRHIILGLVFAGLTGTFIACYTLFDTWATRAGESPWTFIVWSNILFVPMFLGMSRIRSGPGIWAGIWKGWKLGSVLGAIATVGYAMALYAFATGHVSTLAAMRETSIVFATLIAVFILKEPVTGWRLFAAGAITLGAVMTRM